MPEAYYRVPVFTARTIRVERGGRLGLTASFPAVEETAVDHGIAALGGLAVFGVGAAVFPGVVGLTAMLGGAVLAGWAGNNALIAWRCDRVEGADAA